MYDIRHLNDNEISVSAGEAAFPVPFREGLLYSSPARGTWTIAHTSMLIPGSHQIFVCPSCCLRGVVLSAEEMGAMERFSMLEFTDDHILRGDLEDMIIEGVSGILNEMPKKPTCVLLYTSCVQHFLNIDLNLVYRECAKAHPEVDFIDCYMLPTMRKHFSPEKMQWRQLYRAVKKLPEDAHLANVIGSFYEIQPESELFEIFNNAGVRVSQLPTMVSYDEYKHMGAAAMNLFFHPVVDFAAKDMEKRLGQKAVYMPVSFNYEEIRRSEMNLAEALREILCAGGEFHAEDARTGEGAAENIYVGNVHAADPCNIPEIRLPDYDALQKEAEEALAGALDVIGQTPIALDFSAVTRPLSLARMLLEHGFCVRRIYADAFAPEEKGDFEVIRERFPDVKIFPMTQPGMRVAGRNAPEFLAIGQKATYFTGTRHFVNLVENGGLYGFRGITRIAQMMVEAFETEKNPRDFIEIKALGCAENCARLADVGGGNGAKRTDAGCGNGVIPADDSRRNDRAEMSGGGGMV